MTDEIDRLKPLLGQVRAYIRESIQATRQCEVELPQYKGPRSAQHMAALQSILDQINAIVPDGDVIPLRPQYGENE